MNVTVSNLTDKKIILDTARATVWKDDALKEPSKEFMENIYFSEHSPIYAHTFLIEIKGIKSWIATHLVRHHEGYVPFVSTQRNDRHISEIPRDKLPQGSLVNISIVLNAEAFINVSRRRLCCMAHKETRDVWNEVLEKLKDVDNELYRCCVPNCVYRNGICPEGKNCCGYNQTELFKKNLVMYLEGRN